MLKEEYNNSNMEKQKVIVFESDKKFYYYIVFSFTSVIEMTNFESLKECKDFLEKHFNYEVLIAK